MQRGRIAVRVVLAGLCALTLVSMRPARAEGPLFPEKSLRGLTAAARKIARVGKGHLASEILDVAEGLGYPAAKVAKVRAECAKAAESAKTRKAASALSRAARDVRRSLKSLVSALPDLPEAERVRAAPLLLRLDPGCGDAHRALEHELVDGEWMTAELRKLRPRHLGFREVLRKARSHSFDLTIEPCTDPLLGPGPGPNGHRVTCGKFELRGSQSPARLERIMRESLRATLVAGWLLTGEAKLPPMRLRCRIVLLASRAAYQRAVDLEVERGVVELDQVPMFRECGSYIVKDHLDPNLRRSVRHAHAEAPCEAAMMSLRLTYSAIPPFVVFTDQFVQPALRSGLLNLVCLAYLGCPMPLSAWTSRTGEGGRESTTERQIPRELFHLPRAGLAGSRRYMAWLAREQKDPPWVRTFRDRSGKIAGDERLKATSMAEFLAEHGPLLPLFRATSIEKVAGGKIVRALEGAIGEPLARLESRWRSWLLRGAASGILARLEGRARPDESLSPAARRTLAYLNRLRAEARVDPVRFDFGLGEDAERHAVYLSKNPGQASRWPDAHEEYPDRPGFSPRGSWAGLHSVIAPGTDSVEDAIDAWLGTFYHRLPLLHPGLLAVGWGSCERFVVLDSGSLVVEPRFAVEVPWPARGAKGVPTCFAPELPNPVPGEDQSRWGYPVTLQLWTESGEDMVDVTMTLHEGKRGGSVVPCHDSTPARPSNPELAPANAYCLIPRSHLRPGTRYVVVAKIVDPAREIVWDFTTAR